VSCNLADSGVATACDANDTITISFLKPNQNGNLNGFDLYRATEASLSLTTVPPDSPIVFGNSCVSTGFAPAPGTLPGALVTTVEPLDTVGTGADISTPASRAVLTYLVCHHQIVGNGPAPCSFSRPGAGGGKVPRFASKGTAVSLCP
jgi:hypothetical protein